MTLLVQQPSPARFLVGVRVRPYANSDGPASRVRGQFGHFNYDFVHVSATQDDIFQTLAVPLVHKLVQGKSSAVLLYGASQTGKTYTLEGLGALGGHMEGLIPRSLALLLHLIKQQGLDTEVTATQHALSTGHVPHITDLQAPGAPPQPLHEVHEQPHTCLLQPRLAPVHLQRVGDVYELLRSARCVGALGSPPSCSPSSQHFRKQPAAGRAAAGARPGHVMLTLSIEVPDEAEEGGKRTVSMSFVELAPPVLRSQLAASGQIPFALRPLAKAYTALASVLLGLRKQRQRAHQGGPSVHIPWREAPLTRWLQRALGGAAYVLLLATVAPGPDAAADTLSVLNWASKFRSDGAARRASGLWTSPEGDLEAPVALRRGAVEPVKRRWHQDYLEWRAREHARLRQAGLLESGDDASSDGSEEGGSPRGHSRNHSPLRLQGEADRALVRRAGVTLEQRAREEARHDSRKRDVRLLRKALKHSLAELATGDEERDSLRRRVEDLNKTLQGKVFALHEEAQHMREEHEQERKQHDREAAARLQQHEGQVQDLHSQLQHMRREQQHLQMQLQAAAAAAKAAAEAQEAAGRQQQMQQQAAAAAALLKPHMSMPGYPYLGPVDRQHLQYQLEVSQAAAAAPGRQVSGRTKSRADGRRQAPGLSAEQAASAGRAPSHLAATHGQQGHAEVAGSTHVRVAGGEDAASAWPCATSPSQPAALRGLQPSAGAATSDQELHPRDMSQFLPRQAHPHSSSMSTAQPLQRALLPAGGQAGRSQDAMAASQPVLGASTVTATRKVSSRRAGRGPWAAQDIFATAEDDLGSETDSLDEVCIEQQKLQAEQLQQLLRDADASRQQLADLQQKLDAARKDLGASAGDKKLLQEQKERLSAEHQGLQGRLQQEEQAFAQLQQQLKDSRQQQQGLKEELQLLEVQRGRLTAERDSAQRQLQEAQAQAQGLQKELQDSQQHGRRVQGDLDEQAARLAQAKQDLAEQQQVLRGTGAEASLVPALQEQLGQAREQIRELQGECAGLRAKVQAGGNQAGDLQQQQATLKLQLVQVQEQLEAARAVEADLRGQVHSSQQEVQSETQQLQASRLAIAELEVQLAASREQGQAKSESIQRVMEQQQQAAEENARLHRELDIAKSQLSAAEYKQQRGQQASSAVQGDLLQTQKQVKQLQQGLAESQAEAQELKSKLAVQVDRAAVSSQASSEEAAAKLLHANTLTARQKEEIADLRKLNMQLFTSLETLRVQLDSAERRCNSQELAGSVAAMSQQAQAASLKYGNLAGALEGPGPHSSPRYLADWLRIKATEHSGTARKPQLPGDGPCTPLGKQVAASADSIRRQLLHPRPSSYPRTTSASRAGSPPSLRSWTDQGRSSPAGGMAAYSSVGARSHGDLPSRSADVGSWLVPASGPAAKPYMYSGSGRVGAPPSDPRTEPRRLPAWLSEPSRASRGAPLTAAQASDHGNTVGGSTSSLLDPHTQVSASNRPLGRSLTFDPATTGGSPLQRSATSSPARPRPPVDKIEIAPEKVDPDLLKWPSSFLQQELEEHISRHALADA